MDSYFKQWKIERENLQIKINLKENCSCKAPQPTSDSFGKGVFHYCKNCFKNYDRPYYVSRSKS
jgi:hypothetical protein